MADPAALPTRELEHARDMGAATYLAAYLRLMIRELGVEKGDAESQTAMVRSMVLQMIAPMNHATESIWRAMMEDNKGMEEALQRLRDSLDELPEQSAL